MTFARGESITTAMSEDEIQTSSGQNAESEPVATEPKPDAPLTASDLENVHPADVADHLENLTLPEQVALVESLPLGDAAETLEEMAEHARSQLLEELDPALAADILEEMSPDDAADALDELKEEVRDTIMDHVESKEAQEIVQLMGHDPDTAGGVMNTEVVILDHGLTVDQAISMIRTEIEDKEIPYYAYLVDEDEKLVGVLSLRDLLMSRPGKLLKDLVENQSLISVVFDVDREEVAHLLGHYNFMALPVVDYEGRLMGIVTHDDVYDIMHEEASEDMLGMVGAGVDETVDTPWRSSVLKRLPWLFINLANSSLAAWVVHFFEGTIAQMAILASLMLIVSNQAGNTGQQSLAIIIRQLAMERFDRKRLWMAVLREVKVGAVNGVLLGGVVFGVVYLVMDDLTVDNLLVAQVMAYALALDMVLGALAGAAIPLVLKGLGRDPAQASSIFLTTLTDSAGFFIFLGLAKLFIF